MRNGCRILVESLKIPLGRCMSRGKDYVKMFRREVEDEGLDCINLTLDKDQ
jgi:hypothetical protein